MSLNNQSRKSCPISWESMSLSSNENKRFCGVCNKNVHDITQLNTQEINSLVQLHNNDLCVKAYRHQLPPTNNSFINKIIKKAKVVGVVVLLSLFSQGLIAQDKIKKKEYKYKQTETIGKKVTIQGVTVLKGKLRNKKIEGFLVEVFTKDGLKVSTIETDEKGRFSLEIDKDILGDSYSIQVNNFEFNSINVKSVKTMDTQFKLKFKKIPSYQFIGRYF